MDKLRWFAFYPQDFLTDEKVQMMTYQEVGIYCTLLCHQWIQGSIPADPSELQDLLKLDPDSALDLMPLVAKTFFAHPRQKNRLINKRLYKEWQESKRLQGIRSKAGKKAMDNRWHNSVITKGNYIPNHTRPNQREEKKDPERSPQRPVDKSTGKAVNTYLPGARELIDKLAGKKGMP